MKKESVIFLILSVIRMLYTYIPVAVIKYGNPEMHIKMQQFVNSGTNHKLSAIVMVSYYLIFVVCLSYGVIKRHTTSYVWIWLTWFSYILINYWLLNSSFFFLN